MAKRILTRDEMIQKLTRSGNDSVRNLCNRILSKQTTIEEERRYTGSFMSAVLDGNYEDAIARADLDNRTALTRED